LLYFSLLLLALPCFALLCFAFALLWFALLFNPSMLTSVRCTDLQFFIRPRPRYTVRSWVHLKVLPI
jgi:hypothetical protein